MSDEPPFGSYEWQQRQFQGGDGTGLMVLLFIIVFFGVFILAWKIIVGVVRLFAHYPKVMLSLTCIVLVVGILVGTSAFGERRVSPAPVDQADARSEPDQRVRDTVFESEVNGVPASVNEVVPDTVSIASLLPTEDEVPVGMVVLDDYPLSARQVAKSFADAERTRQRLTDWGWQGTVVRNFGVSEGDALSPKDVNYIRIRIHQFEDSSPTAEAMAYMVEDNLAQYGGSEVAAERIGDGSRAVTGIYQGDNYVSLYVQDGSTLVYLDSYSPTGDPMPSAVAVAQAIVAR